MSPPKLPSFAITVDGVSTRASLAIHCPDITPEEQIRILSYIFFTKIPEYKLNGITGIGGVDTFVFYEYVTTIQDMGSTVISTTEKYVEFFKNFMYTLRSEIALLELARFK